MVRRLAPLILAAALAACSSPSEPTPPTKTAAPRGTQAPSTAPSADPGGTPRPGPTGYATNRPSVSVSANPTPTPTPTPAPAATFGPIAAGLLNAGDGRDPRSTPLGSLGDLEVGGDGTLWIAAATKLWKLPPGGKLALVGGAHRTPGLDLAGKPASDAGFGADTPLTLHPDGERPPLLAYEHALARLGDDGKLTVLWRGDDAVAGILPLGAGKYQLLIRSGDVAAGGGRFAWWSAREGASPIRLRAASEAEADVLREGAGWAYLDLGQQGPLGVASGGKLLVRTHAGEVHELDPGGAAPRRVGGSGFKPRMIDGRGKAYTYDPGAGKLASVSAAKAGETLVGSLPEGFQLAGVASDAAGAVWVAGHPAGRDHNHGRIYKLAGGGVEIVAGVTAPALGAPLDTPLRPTGMVALGPGELLVADELRGQILRVRPDQPVAALYGKPGGGDPADGMKAADAALDPRGLARDGEGRLYFLQGSHELWRIDAGGQLARLYLEPTSGDGGLLTTLTHLAATPAGDVLVAGLRGVVGGEITGFLIHVSAAGKAAPVPLTPGGERIQGLATASDGSLVFGLTPASDEDLASRDLRLMRWTAADGVEEAAAGSWRANHFRFGVLGADAKGRWYVVSGAGAPGAGASAIATLTRLDPADGTRKLLTGPGAAAFAGDTADDSLIAPLGWTLLGSEAFFADGEQIKHLTGLAD